jgi:hypothetical protein
MARGRWLTPETPGDSNISRCLSIPEHLQPMANYALETLTYAENWEALGALTPQECADAFKVVLAAYYDSEDCMTANNPSELFAFWYEGNPSAGGALLANVLTTQWWNVTWHQNPIAQNDTMDFTVMLQDGTYDLTVTSEHRTNAGIMHVLVDGNEDAQTIDMHASSNGPNFQDTISIVVPESGVHLLQFKISTKNGSSANYGAYVQAIRLHRTGS